MAVESSFGIGGRGTFDMGADFGDDGCAKGYVWDKVSVHYVNLFEGQDGDVDL